jgi:integrase
MARVKIREKLLSDGKVSLILDYTVNGERRKQTLKIYVDPKDAKSRNLIHRNAYEEAYKQAELIRLKLETQLVSQEHDLPTAYDKRASFLAYFEKLATTRNHNWTSVAKYLRIHAKGQLAFGSITEEWIKSLQDYLCSCMQHSSVSLYIGIVNSSLNLAVQEKLIPANPAKNVRKVQIKEKPPKYLTKEQVQQLMEQREGIPDWIVQPFLFSCYTGLRLSDVEALVWADLHPTGTSPEGLEQFTIIRQQIKTGNTVHVPLSPKALAIVEDLKKARIHSLQAQEPVFALKGRTATKRYIRMWRKQTGIPFTYHSSRHTFGTGLQSAGVDINTTSKLMGHKSLGMTMRYAKVVDRQRNEAIDKMAAYWG